MTIRVMFALLCALFWTTAADAQGLQRVPSCGTGTPGPGMSPGTQDTTGNGCVSGTVTTTPTATTAAGGNQYALAVVSATALTVPALAKAAQIIVESQPVRCTDDGTTTPTSTVGALYNVGTVIIEYQPALASMKCIQTASAATLDVSYYK